MATNALKNTARALRGASGFTLIELLVVIAILGILAAIIAPKVIGRADEAKVTEAKVQIRNLETALKMYKLDNGAYPSTEQGIAALVEKPATGIVPKNWRQGGYLEKKKVPTDPWGNQFVYVSPGLNDDYDIISYGADGAKGGEKFDADIESWDLD
ncbi:MAG: type II secretion system protein GspG [Deltaproteobacteria bacterium GWB2_55_19]|nr:MAG: type II secretion system protein GspG [Deltaproteobacteria bacterium GWB2_55_19]HAO94285.1 type II secretion system protein GspG [Deltaproteobacteria bacterium]